MVSFPPCKINLGLQVIEKRSDGYHNLETCFYPVPWCDILEIVPAQEFSFVLTGDAIPGDANENLSVKAYRLLAAEYNLPPVAIHLHKIIPTGAGLGGGSADAAHTLRSLNKLFHLDIDQGKLLAFAAQLGSDCAFFVQDKPMIGTGRGEILQPAPRVSLANKFLVIVKPAIHVSTAEAYAGITPQRPDKLLNAILSEVPVNLWKDVLINDFEKSVFVKYPAIASIKEKLYQQGAVYASMSGSGAAVFGIFDEGVDLKAGFSDCAYWSGALNI
jgi:4-diphosphocytidyl-2-C-methyl-D-erythritol kinase